MTINQKNENWNFSSFFSQFSIPSWSEKGHEPSRAELKILQLELWLEPARLRLITITYVLTSSHKAAPSLGCKVVVYSVNYNFCLNQISLNFYKINSEAAFPFSQSHTVVDACDIKKEVTLLYGLFLTLRCKLYQKGVKKSWSEFSYILCRGKKGDSIVMKLSNSWKI